AGGNRLEGRQAGGESDAADADRSGSATAGSSRGQHARAASARSVQEQGHSLRRGTAAQEGRQDRCGRGEVVWHVGIRRTKFGCAFTSASGTSCRERSNGRVWRCSAAWVIL